MTKFTGQHYNATAHLLRRRNSKKFRPLARLMIRLIIRDFADMFSGDNERFDRRRFYEACGLSADEVVCLSGSHDDERVKV